MNRIQSFLLILNRLSNVKRMINIAKTITICPASRPRLKPKSGTAMLWLFAIITLAVFAKPNP